MNWVLFIGWCYLGNRVFYIVGSNVVSCGYELSVKVKVVGDNNVVWKYFVWRWESIIWVISGNCNFIGYFVSCDSIREYFDMLGYC